MSNVTHAIGGPLWKFKTQRIDNSVMASIVSYFGSKSGLEKENKQLKDKVSELEMKLVDYDVIKSENDSLRTSLGMRSINDDVVFAYVLKRPSATPYDTLVLGAGITEGVRVGDGVRVGGTQYIGTITRVNNNTSIATLYSTPENTHEVVIADILSGTAEGIGNGNFLITLPRDISVSEGMSVRLSSFPRTLLGFIESVEKEPSESFQDILVRSPIRIQTLNHVFITRSSQ